MFLILFGIRIYRKRLFQMINDLPTIFEVVTGNVKQSKDQSATHNSSKSKLSGKTVRNCWFNRSCSFFMPPSCKVLTAFYFDVAHSSPDNLSPSPREWRCLHHPRKRTRVAKKMKKMMNRVQLVGPVGITMVLTNFGFAVIFVRDGSMANV